MDDRSLEPTDDSRNLLNLPVLTFAIIAFSCIMYAIEVNRYGSSPQAFEVEAMGGMTLAAAKSFDWRAIFMSNFLHFSPIHIVGNMFIIFMMGSAIERLLGRVRFVLLVLLACVSTAFVGAYWEGAHVVGAGASGIAFALIGCGVGIDYRRQIGVGSAAWQLLILNAIFTFTVPGISVGGHVGGAASGLIVGVLLRSFVLAKFVRPKDHSIPPAAAMQPVSFTAYPANLMRVVGPNRGSLVLLILFTALIAYMAPKFIAENDPNVWLIYVIAPIIGFGLAAQMPGAMRILLSPDGFAVRKWYKTASPVHWDAIELITTVDPNSPTIVWKLKPQFRDPESLQHWDGHISFRSWAMEAEDFIEYAQQHIPSARIQPLVDPSAAIDEVEPGE